MAPSRNRHLTDALTRRALLARRGEARQRQVVWAGLAVLAADLVAALTVADPTESPLLARRRRAVAALMADTLGPMITVRYARLATTTTEMLVSLARSEGRAVHALVSAGTAPEALPVPGAAPTIRRRVEDALMPTAVRPTDLSTTGVDWWQRQGVSLTQRLGDQLMVSVSLEESVPQAVARLRGTRTNGFKNGLMAKARQDAARLLQTQVTSALTQAREVVAAANAGQIILEHSSIIDNKTSLICLSRDGLRYRADTFATIGHSIPYLGGPPYHPSCRSQMLTVLADGGAVPPETLGGWLHRQGGTVQDEILGPTRAQMFRDGRLRSVRDLLDAAGRPLTVEEMAP